MSTPYRLSAIISWCRGWHPQHEIHTPQVKESFLNFANNLVRFIRQAPLARLRNGHCACLRHFWPIRCSIPPSRCTFQQFAHCTSIRAFHILSSYLRVGIKSSKTDPFRKGCFVHIGRGTYPLCALQSLLSYLTIRGDGPGPLFLFQDGRPLSRSLLTAWLRRILASAGVHGNFSSHSFRIGAATVAARNGIPDHQIQALGRWSSTAYLSYIRTPAETLSKLSKQLTAGAAALL